MLPRELRDEVYGYLLPGGRVRLIRIVKTYPTPKDNTHLSMVEFVGKGFLRELAEHCYRNMFFDFSFDYTQIRPWAQEVDQHGLVRSELVQNIGISMDDDIIFNMGILEGILDFKNLANIYVTLLPRPVFGRSAFTSTIKKEHSIVKIARYITPLLRRVRENGTKVSVLTPNYCGLGAWMVPLEDSEISVQDVQQKRRTVSHLNSPLTVDMADLTVFTIGARPHRRRPTNCQHRRITRKDRLAAAVTCCPTASHLQWQTTTIMIGKRAPQSDGHVSNGKLY